MCTFEPVVVDRATRPAVRAEWALRAWRWCPHREPATYYGVVETPTPAALTALVQMGHRVGTVISPVDDSPEPGGCVGLLDLHDEHGRRRQDWLIPSEDAWTWWATAIDLRITDSTCPHCLPPHRTSTDRKDQP